MTVDAEPDQVARAQRNVGVETALLRDVADAGIALAQRGSGDLARTRGERREPEQDLEQAGLAAAVGPEDREELARLRRRDRGASQSARSPYASEASRQRDRRLRGAVVIAAPTRCAMASMLSDIQLT